MPNSFATCRMVFSFPAWAISISEGTGRSILSFVGLKEDVAAEILLAVFFAFTLGLAFVLTSFLMSFLTGFFADFAWAFALAAIKSPWKLYIIFLSLLSFYCSKKARVFVDLKQKWMFFTSTVDYTFDQLLTSLLAVSPRFLP